MKLKTYRREDQTSRRRMNQVKLNARLDRRNKKSKLTFFSLARYTFPNFPLPSGFPMSKSLNVHLRSPMSPFFACSSSDLFICFYAEKFNVSFVSIDLHGRDTNYSRTNYTSLRISINIRNAHTFSVHLFPTVQLSM